jgi:hypothetical protein
MSGRSESRRSIEMDEGRFPHFVEVGLPPEALGSQFDEMRAMTSA